MAQILRNCIDNLQEAIFKYFSKFNAKIMINKNAFSRRPTARFEIEIETLAI